MAIDANSRGITDESSARGGIEIGDVVGCVAGSVEDLQLVIAERQNFPAFEDVQVRRGNRKELPEQGAHFFAVQAVSASKKILRIGHVRSAA